MIVHYSSRKFQVGISQIEDAVYYVLVNGVLRLMKANGKVVDHSAGGQSDTGGDSLHK